MAANNGPAAFDPLQLWREALSQWETRVNDIAGREMGSPEFARAVHLLSGSAVRMQEAVVKGNAALMKELNLPTRNDLIDIGVRLQRIEEALELLTREKRAAEPAGITPKPMPARTRKPPQAAATAVAPAVTATGAPAAPRKASAPRKAAPAPRRRTGKGA
ncbi:hypothetical protein QTI66_02155 [Variovorax sp. J22R133]|uniref:hypothetical protein n=1 Tax=Variovorax brevis TaxID=3053503 RepID=UPI00257803BC|nr:hypothetical protein [Variovorax sp. J22R133]MDM0110928.1 hypothetical protein [Variovorax sp. J22R133]